MSNTTKYSVKRYSIPSRVGTFPMNSPFSDLNLFADESETTKSILIASENADMKYVAIIDAWFATIPRVESKELNGFLIKESKDINKLQFNFKDKSIYYNKFYTVDKDEEQLKHALTKAWNQRYARRIAHKATYKQKIKDAFTLGDIKHGHQYVMHNSTNMQRWVLVKEIQAKGISIAYYDADPTWHPSRLDN
jgi:hypothetical protein